MAHQKDGKDSKKKDKGKDDSRSKSKDKSKTRSSSSSGKTKKDEHKSDKTPKESSSSSSSKHKHRSSEQSKGEEQSAPNTSRNNTSFQAPAQEVRFPQQQQQQQQDASMSIPVSPLMNSLDYSQIGQPSQQTNFYNHNLVPFNTSTNDNNINGLQVPTCPLHPGRPLTHFCVGCGVACCEVCALSGPHALGYNSITGDSMSQSFHGSSRLIHNVATIDVCAQEALRSLNDSQYKLRGVKETVQTSLVHLDSIIEAGDRRRQEIEEYLADYTRNVRLSLTKEITMKAAPATSTANYARSVLNEIRNVEEAIALSKKIVESRDTRLRINWLTNEVPRINRRIAEVMRTDSGQLMCDVDIDMDLRNELAEVLKTNRDFVKLQRLLSINEAVLDEMNNRNETFRAEVEEEMTNLLELANKAVDLCERQTMRCVICGAICNSQNVNGYCPMKIQATQSPVVFSSSSHADSTFRDQDSFISTAATVSPLSLSSSSRPNNNNNNNNNTNTLNNSAIRELNQRFANIEGSYNSTKSENGISRSLSGKGKIGGGAAVMPPSPSAEHVVVPLPELSDQEERVLETARRSEAILKACPGADPRDALRAAGAGRHFFAPVVSSISRK